MFKARYYKADGKKGKAQTLPDAIFDGNVNEGAMHQVVRAYLSNRRQGTAAAKTRSEVRGGSSKPWRQKGTGRARAGTIRSPLWEGGGVAFPPIPHSWRQRVPKKVRSLARRSALNDRAENDRVIVADMPAFERPRTRDIAGFIGALELEGKTLILTDGRNENVYLSARNLEQVQVLPFGNESVYDVLWANTVVIEKSALDGASAPAEKAPPKKAAKPKVEKVEAQEPVVEEPAVEDGAAAEDVAVEAAAEDVAAEAEAEAATDEAATDEAATAEAATDEGAAEPEADAAADSEDEETEEKTDA